MHNSSRGLKVDVSCTRSGTFGVSGALTEAAHSEEAEEVEQDEEGGGEAGPVMVVVSGKEEGGVGGVGREGEADVDADGGGEVEVEDVKDEVEDALERRWWVCV